jgi:2-polyprenyl-3-methyl-5-hydroxy-6-metoxy-1,4-benzoquinol methylase
MPIGLPRIEPESLGMDPEAFDRLRNVYGVQSCVFICEILPTLWGLYPEGLHRLSLLDVGSQTGTGSELLRYLHHPASFSRIKLDVTALDIDTTYRDYSRVLFPELRSRYEDIFSPDFSERYDIVLCSHCIEHVEDPSAFLARMQTLARQWVIVATPFGEKELIPGHLHRFDFEFFRRTGAVRTQVYRSLTWHGSMACVAVYRASDES